MFEKSFCLVAIDDSSNWDPNLVDKCGGRIFTLYVFDQEDMDYCNSDSPNLRLLPVQSIPATQNLTDYEAVCEQLQEGFSGCGELYVHFKEINRINPDMRVEKSMEEDTSLEEAVSFFYENKILPKGLPA